MQNAELCHFRTYLSLWFCCFSIFRLKIHDTLYPFPSSNSISSFLSSHNIILGVGCLFNHWCNWWFYYYRTVLGQRWELQHLTLQFISIIWNVHYSRWIYGAVTVRVVFYNKLHHSCAFLPQNIAFWFFL